jgi:archaellin
MELGYGWILALFLVSSVFSAGCITENTPAPAPVGGSIPQDGVLIQNFGNVTGQGIILEGVPRGTIDTITFAVGLAPGIKTVDLTNMTVVYADAVRPEILTPVGGYRGNPPPGYWGIIDTINEAGNSNMRLDFEEQFVIRINPKAAVVPNQVITISAKPSEGKPLVIRRVAPSIIYENDNILPGI